MKKGIFCISLDTELLWGRRADDYMGFKPLAKNERKVIKRILSLFRKYNIPATWAIVGHLFLNQCILQNGVKHPEIKRFKKQNTDWFAPDPATDIKRDPLWYGRDIIEMIQKDKNQEIGSHSFSHIRFGDKHCTKEIAESEIKACVKVADKLKMKSFVYPYNSIQFTSLLKKYKFICYRSAHFSWYHKIPYISKLIDAVILLLPTAPQVYDPSFYNGLVAIPGSHYFVSARGIRKIIPKGVRSKKAIRGINAAIKHKKIFHLWSHPIDFVKDEEKIFSDLQQILMYASKKRDEGELEIISMGDIAKSNLHEH